MKVFLYMRVSSEEQVKHGYSLDAQEQALKDFCEKNDHVILGIYKDEGISGRKPYTKRPAMVQLLSDLELVKPDIVLFTKLDRWFRNIKEYYKVQDILDRNKVDWKAINEEYDTTTASGRLYINIKLSIAQDEADRTGERIKDVHTSLVAQGRTLGGTPPFGYSYENKRLVKNENNVIVRDAFEYFMLHQSMNATTRYINEKYGLSKHHSGLLHWFRNPLYKGLYRDNPNFCEPIITPDEFDELQELLNRNIKYASRGRVYLFSGLIICPCCHKKMGGCFGSNRKYYRCTQSSYSTCDNHRTVNEKKLEKYLLENIEQDFKVNVEMKPKEKKEDPQKYRNRLKRLNDVYVLGNITEEEYKKQSAEIQRKIAEIQKKPTLKPRIFTSSWRELYAELSEENKQIFWHNLIKEIRPSVDFTRIEIIY